MITPMLNWINGWRYDLDDWLVRARRETDPQTIPADIGFVEEACVAVRDHRAARDLDLGRIAIGAGRQALAASKGGER